MFDKRRLNAEGQYQARDADLEHVGGNTNPMVQALAQEPKAFQSDVRDATVGGPGAARHADWTRGTGGKGILIQVNAQTRTIRHDQLAVTDMPCLP